MINVVWGHNLSDPIARSPDRQYLSTESVESVTAVPAGSQLRDDLHQLQRAFNDRRVAVVIVSATATLDIDTEQFVRPTVVDVLPPEYDSIDDGSTLFEPAVAAHIIQQLETAIDNSAYRPSIGLCSWVCLYHTLAHKIENGDEGSHESESVVRSAQ